MPTVIGAADLIHAPQPAILAPNHESDIDTPLVLLSLPHAWRTRTVVGAASDRFYRKRGYAIASAFWINTFPFDRGGGQRRGLAAAAAHLRDGRNVLLFPQGTRGAGPDGYRHGVSELAITAGAPIIPVHIEGSALVMPKGRGLNRRAKTKVTFAAPAAPPSGRDPRRADAAPARRDRKLGMAEEEVIELAGREVRITSPGKVLFSERGETKLDLVRYYAAVAEPLLRTMGGRPVLMQRFPQGASGKSFFQKRVPDNAPEWLRDDDGRDRQRHAVTRAGGGGRGARRVGGQPRLPRLPRLAVPRRRPDPHRRAATRPRSDARDGVRRGPRRRVGAQGAARRGRHRVLPEDDRQPRPACVRALAAALGLLRGALGRGRRRARARASPARHPHRRLVEGGAREADLRRLQPERAAQDGLRRLVGAGAQGRAGLDAAELGRARRRRPGRADAGGRSPAAKTPGPRSTTRRSRSSRCSR